MHHQETGLLTPLYLSYKQIGSLLKWILKMLLADSSQAAVCSLLSRTGRTELQKSILYPIRFLNSEKAESSFGGTKGIYPGILSVYFYTYEVNNLFLWLQCCWCCWTHLCVELRCNENSRCELVICFYFRVHLHFCSSWERSRSLQITIGLEVQFPLKRQVCFYCSS